MYFLITNYNACSVEITGPFFFEAVCHEIVDGGNYFSLSLTAPKISAMRMSSGALSHFQTANYIELLWQLHSIGLNLVQHRIKYSFPESSASRSHVSAPSLQTFPKIPHYAAENF